MLYAWIFFNLFALAVLALDLRLSRRKAGSRPRRALTLSAIWIALAAAFAAFVFFWQGRQVALEFVTGYVLELSLSVDNLFLFLVIFRYFAVPEERQSRVLTWGILGAMLMRGLFIVLGVGLLERFHWIFYALGALLIYSGIRLAFSGQHKVDPSVNPVVKLMRRFIPVTDGYDEGKFFVRNWRGKAGLYATPLLVVLVVIETTDLIFAIDSIPAVLAITLNAFIVYAANVFAIIGLRSIYFAISEMMKVFRFLHKGLALILMLVGAKMIAADYVHLSTLAMLSVVAGILTVSVAASMLVRGGNVDGMGSDKS
ncbi:MAG TPA: TerC/Alx family metal homeostasis membrane protein [Candidatus Sulfotelmatobacter sp.]